MSRATRGRIRTIKPELWDSEDIGALSLPARLLFIGLITRVDDDGRSRDSAPWLKGQLFPYDEEVTPAQVEQWLTELHERRMVVRYEAGGKRYLALTAWRDHQVISHPSPSAIPPPPGDDIPPGGMTNTAPPPTDDQIPGNGGPGEETAGQNGQAERSGGIRRNPEESGPRGRAPDLDLNLDLDLDHDHSLSSSARSSSACSCPQDDDESRSLTAGIPAASMPTSRSTDFPASPADDQIPSRGADAAVVSALKIIGARRHTEAVAAGEVSENHSKRRGHRRSCIKDCVADLELQAQVSKAFATHPDWTPEQVAEHLASDDSVPDPRPAQPACQWCRGVHAGGYLCSCDPSHPQYVDHEEAST